MMPVACYQVVLKGRLFAHVETRNVFYWGGGTRHDSEFCVSVMQKISDMWSCISSDIAVLSWNSYALEVKYWDGEVFVPFYETEYDLTEVLSNEGDAQTYQGSAVLTMLTGHLKTRGRKFIAGVIKESTLGGSLVGASLTRFSLLIVEWLTDIPIAGTEYVPGVVGKGNNWYGFIGGTIGSILGTIRRRKPGYGA